MQYRRESDGGSASQNFERHAGRFNTSSISKAVGSGKSSKEELE
jgi:hypothetical protein